MSLEARLELRQREAKSILHGCGPTHRHDAQGCAPQESFWVRRWAMRRTNGPRWLDTWKSLKPSWTINSIEHTSRGVVLGRRNWLHVGQEAGGEKAANLFSLMIYVQAAGEWNLAPTSMTSCGRLPSHPNKTSGS